jgi:MFS family permease
VAWLTAYALLMGVGVGAVGAYLPLYAVEELGFPAARAGLAAALMGFVGVIARIVWGRRADTSHLPVPVALTWLAAGSAAATGLVWGGVALGAWALWAGALLLGATAVAWNAVGMLAIVREAATAGSGRASGRVLLGFYGGFVASPIAVGWLVDRTGGYGPGWALVGAAFLVAGVLAVAWGRRAVSPPPATTPPSPPGW